MADEDLTIARMLQSPARVAHRLRGLATYEPLRANLLNEQRAAARDRQAQRAEQRRAAKVVPVTTQRLVEKLGWSDAYAEHFVQPYCTCDDTDDGWDYCAHAVDEGVAY